MDFLRKHGLTIDDTKDIIFNLNYTHYYKGPENDRDTEKEGEVWFFIYPFMEIEIDIYIKLRLEINTQVVCLSFHEEGEF